MDVFAVAAESEGSTPLALILIAAAAFLIPLLARKVRLPAVVLEIAFGLLVGPELLGLVEVEELLGFLAELGLFLLMFLAGFEIDFGRLKQQGSRALVGASIVVAGFYVAAFFGVGLLGSHDLDQRIFLMLLLGASALGLVVPTLRGTRRSTTPVGQTAILISVLAEVVSLTGIVIFLVIDEKGLGPDILNVPVLFLAVGLALLAVKRAAWWYPERFERLFNPNDPEEMGIRATLALMFVLVGLSLELGIEGILGAFLAGALFAFVFRERGGLEEQLSGFAYGFFIPIFFIVVGIEFPLGRLGDSDVLADALLLIGVAIAIKLGPALLLMFRGYGFREALAMGVLAAGQLSVIIALAAVGVEAGLMTEGEEAGAILLVAVTAVFTPVVFRLLQPPLAEDSEPHDHVEY